MLETCISIFMDEFEKEGKGLSLILKDYTLAPGNYYFVNYNTGETLESLLVEGQDQEKTKLYRQFQIRDYLSSLLTMNKPIDARKQIHSNNYLSFFVKKDKISGDKVDFEILKERINKYYETMKDYSTRYDRKKLEILATLNRDFTEKREQKINKVSQWINNNFRDFSTFQDFKEDKNYFKVFFVSDKEDLIEDSKFYEDNIKEYEEESLNYISPHIYNKNAFNQKIDDIVYGVPNDNFGMNSKKPFLVNKDRKSKSPWLLSMEDIQKQKLFFDWLFALSGSKLYNVYIGKAQIDGEMKNVMEAVKTKEAVHYKRFNGYYLRIKKEKNEAEIVDYDIINNSQEELEHIHIFNYLNLSQKMNDEIYSTASIDRNTALHILDKCLFANRLQNSFFLDAKDISKDDPAQKDGILRIRDMLKDWYFKSKDIPDTGIFERITYDLLIRHLKKNQMSSLAHGYNVRKSWIKYIKNPNGKGEFDMSEIRYWNELRNKVITDDTSIIESDDEFSFAVGQLWYYLINQSEAEKKNYDLLLPVLQATKLDRVKKLTVDLIKTYAHAIWVNNKRVDGMIAMITSYETDEFKLNEEWVLAGFATNNMLYEKNEEEKNK